MRISKGLIAVTAVGLVIGLVPTLPFDNARSPDALPQGASDSSRLGIESLSAGDPARAAKALQYAAENGNELAAWQLGHMYASGKGVERNDYRAFEYFQKFADRNANINPASERARYAADAFISLGKYYLDGIPGSPVTANPAKAQRMFNHAASYFGDPVAQYQLARLLLEGQGVNRDPKRAVQWLINAANKRHHESQALLGRILFQGELGKREPAVGLMWLIIATDGPGGSVPWISALHDSAFKQATDKERQAALVLLERWVDGRRE